MTFGVRSNSSFFHKQIQCNLEGESSNLSEVTEGFLPGTLSIMLIFALKENLKLLLTVRSSFCLLVKMCLSIVCMRDVSHDLVYATVVLYRCN